jgi:aubergine-like protein
LYRIILKEYFRPKLAVIIVKKKGNARFFAKMGSTSMANPPPGTIIDHTVTNQGLYFNF